MEEECRINKKACPQAYTLLVAQVFAKPKQAKSMLSQHTTAILKSSYQHNIQVQRRSIPSCWNCRSY